MAPAVCAAERSEGWRCPSQVWLGLCCCLHSNYSTPSVQIAPFLKQVTVVSGSEVGGAHSPVPDCACLFHAYTRVSFPQRKWAGWVQVACEALPPATSRISLTFCPFWHPFTLFSGLYFGTVTQTLTLHFPALLPSSQTSSWLFCSKMPTNPLSVIFMS